MCVQALLLLNNRTSFIINKTTEIAENTGCQQFRAENICNSTEITNLSNHDGKSPASMASITTHTHTQISRSFIQHPSVGIGAFATTSTLRHPESESGTRTGAESAHLSK